MKMNLFTRQDPPNHSNTIQFVSCYHRSTTELNGLGRDKWIRLRQWKIRRHMPALFFLFLLLLHLQNRILFVIQLKLEFFERPLIKFNCVALQLGWRRCDYFYFQFHFFCYLITQIVQILRRQHSQFISVFNLIHVSFATLLSMNQFHQ